MTSLHSLSWSLTIRYLSLKKVKNNKIQHVAGLDGYCQTENCRPRPQHRLKQNSTFKDENGEILNLDVSIRRLSWNPKCDAPVPFHEKRRMVPK
jgi:hypothetical protein